jgi:hypothetical protein
MFSEALRKVAGEFDMDLFFQSKPYLHQQFLGILALNPSMENLHQ